MLRVTNTVQFKKETVKVRHLVSDYMKGIIKLPDWQRESWWSVSRKQALIDSILLEIPIGEFIFVKGDDTIYIADGQQRLNALLEFYQDKLEIGEGEYKAKNYSKLPKSKKNAIDEYPITIIEYAFPKEEQLSLFHKDKTFAEKFYATAFLKSKTSSEIEICLKFYKTIERKNEGNSRWNLWEKRAFAMSFHPEFAKFKEMFSNKGLIEVFSYDYYHSVITLTL